MEKIKNLLQKLWQNEKVRIGVISYLIFGIVLSISMFILDNDTSAQFKLVNTIIFAFIGGIMVLIMSSICYIIAFLPVFIGYHFLSKKFNIKQKWIFISVLLPLMSCIYYAIEHYWLMYETYFSLVFNLTILIIIFPIVFLVCACSPKTILTNRKQKLLIIIVSWFIWVAMLLLNVQVTKITENCFDKIALKKCEKLIDKIETYKSTNGKYPSAIKEKLPTKYFGYYRYNTENNNQDYILTINRAIYINYYYCSNKNSEYCKIKRTPYGKTEPFGKWVKFTEFD